MSFEKGRFFTISFLSLLILSSTQLRFMAQGRVNLKDASFPQTEVSEEEKIGSRPPKCQSKCSNCGHCEAIQVPTNPQINYSKSSSSIAYARGDDASNYKPMCWKCKCGNLIFNP